MCLAIPAKITELKADHLAVVDILGVTREVSLDLTPQAQLDDFVLVHAGFAIEVVDESFAQETIDLINQFPELIADDMPSAAESVAAPKASVESTVEPGTNPEVKSEPKIVPNIPLAQPSLRALLSEKE